MKRTSFAAMECPIARALDEVGDAWTLLLLREAMLGATQFGEFQERLGIQSTTLTRRLEELVRNGVFVRRLYTTQPSRYEYVPTEKGAALLPVLLSLAAWGNRWIFGEGAEHIVAADARSGEPVSPRLVDARTRRALTSGAVRLVPGPAASAGLRRALTKNARALGASQPRAGAAEPTQPLQRLASRA